MTLTWPSRAATRAERPRRIRRAAGGTAPLALDLYAGEESTLVGDQAGLVVTPNLDHLRLLERSRPLRRAYRSADRVVNDSRFLDRLSLGALALCWPGSELALAMLDRAPAGSRVVVVGAEAVVQTHLRSRNPGLAFSFIEPSMGYIRSRAERRALVQAVLARKPARVFICTGAPQSEILAAQLKRAGLRAPILCCGSAFRFAAGVAERAPESARRLGGEWLWRFVREPRTRARYLADALFLALHLPAFVRLRREGAADFGPFVIRTPGAIRL